jgi:hypothetical protein
MNPPEPTTRNAKNMKTRPMQFLLAAALLLSTLNSQISTFAQGSLTPPGAPAPTMKSLAQIEPRMPISSAFTITNPGSYYLTTNILVASGNAITISTNDVTLDLNGFAVAAGTAGKGIVVPGAQRNISIRQGMVRNCPSDGISAGTVNGGLFSDLVLANNGGGGLEAGPNCVVKNCSALTNASGIGVGDGSMILHCTARGNTSGIGAGQYCVVTACVASYNGGDGIAVGLGSTVSDCLAANNAGDGVQAADDCRVTGCQCSFNGTDGVSYGIHLTGNYARIEGNHITDNTGSRNLKLDIGSGSLVIRNTISGAGATSFNVPAGNLVGPLLSTATAVATNSNPHANFAF